MKRFKEHCIMGGPDRSFLKHVPDPALSGKELLGFKFELGYIPQDYGHSIEDSGNKPSRVLVGFNAGIYEGIDLSA